MVRVKRFIIQSRHKGEHFSEDKKRAQCSHTLGNKRYDLEQLFAQDHLKIVLMLTSPSSPSIMSAGKIRPSSIRLVVADVNEVRW
jgi:hypothetical protein